MSGVHLWVQSRGFICIPSLKHDVNTMYMLFCINGLTKWQWAFSPGYHMRGLQPGLSHERPSALIMMG
jgi:hypothetical protein